MITILLENLVPGLSTIIFILLIFGMFKVLKKFERNGLWALVPGIRDYKLADCSDRASDGIKYMIFEIIVFCSSVASDIVAGEDVEVTDDNALALLLILGVTVLGAVGSFVYSVRIYLGLCNQFKVSKKWVWFMILFGRFVPLLIWGFGKKYSPEIIKKENTNIDSVVSGVDAEIQSKGLTINIEERTAKDQFKTKYLLRDIHMNIEPGHMVLLLGGSGAGKTTFVNAVNGYEKAKADIVLNNKSIYDDYKQMKYRVGFVPQMDLMRGNDTVLATLQDAAKLRLPSNMSSDDRKSRVEETLDFFGLKPVENKLCDKLSGGQRKRLSIAMEYISNPELFILDEPDSGLDGVMARELMEGLRAIADQGKIVIVITHSPDRVIDLFDDVIVLAKDSNLTGRLTYFGSIEDAKKFFERDKMEEIVMRINRKEEGGEGLADDFIKKYVEVCHA